MACRLFFAKPLPKTNDDLLLIGPLGTKSSEFFYQNENILFVFESVIFHCGAIVAWPK